MTEREQYKALLAAMDQLAIQYAQTHDPNIRDDLLDMSARTAELEKIIGDDSKQTFLKL